nr:unnamed protein product [Callosobruchus analis]
MQILWALQKRVKLSARLIVPSQNTDNCKRTPGNRTFDFKKLTRQASKKRWKTSMHKGKINQAKRFSYPRNNQYKRDGESYRKEKRNKG